MSPLRRLLPLFALAGCAVAAPAPQAALRDALTFHASFDQGPDADFARGDRRVFTAEDRNKRDASAPGLSATGNAHIVAGAGRHGGGALEFRGASKQQVFYRGGANLGLVPVRWSGSASFWLRLDPDADLAPGYCDPVQFVGAKWGDGALFVEFTKDHNPRHFRFGIFPITQLWNPQNKKLEEMTDAERPMVPVRRPIFGRDRWTHILITFANIGSGETDGRGTLYVDGERIGTSDGWNHTFNWPDPVQTALALGLNYTGLIDDLAVFDRELDPAEARAIFSLPRGIADLGAPKK
jgi:hypothetical protein